VDKYKILKFDQHLFTPADPLNTGFQDGSFKASTNSNYFVNFWANSFKTSKTSIYLYHNISSLNRLKRVDWDEKDDQYNRYHKIISLAAGDTLYIMVDCRNSSVQLLNSVLCVEPTKSGGWSEWGSWSTCSRGRELKNRTRQCTASAPLPGGAECPGAGKEEEECAEQRRNFDALFVGPASGFSSPDSGYGPVDSIVYNIPSFQVANCTPPTFPFNEIYDGYVAKLTDEGPMLCGGGNYSCYLLEKYGTWKEVKSMTTPRTRAAAVDIDAGWWVTGGSGDESTELWDGENWRSSVNLPKPLDGHCMVKINSSHVFITAGYDENGYGDPSLSSYIYNGVEFIQVADMPACPTPPCIFPPNIRGHRFGPGCGLHDHRIFVFGGYMDIASSEVFSLKTLTWSKGPDSPQTSVWSSFGFGIGLRLVSINGTTYIIGNNGIYSLATTGESSWEVVTIIEWDGFKSYYDVVPMNLEDCK